MMVPFGVTEQSPPAQSSTPIEWVCGAPQLWPISWLTTMRSQFAPLLLVTG